MPTTPTPKRHPYHQWAPDARALDLVGDKRTLLTVRDGAVTIGECEADIADVREWGLKEGWIAALGPEADQGDLRMERNEPLAIMLLEGIGAFARRADGRPETHSATT